MFFLPFLFFRFLIFIHLKMCVGAGVRVWFTSGQVSGVAPSQAREAPSAVLGRWFCVSCLWFMRKSIWEERDEERNRLLWVVRQDSVEKLDLCAQHLEVVGELAVVDLERAQRYTLWPRRTVAEHIAVCRALGATPCFSFDSLTPHDGRGLVWHSAHHIQHILCVGGSDQRTIHGGVLGREAKVGVDKRRCGGQTPSGRCTARGLLSGGL